MNKKKWPAAKAAGRLLYQGLTLWSGPFLKKKGTQMPFPYFFL
jgi:hypothetical protein